MNWFAPLGLTWRHALHNWLDPLHFVSSLARDYGDIAFFKMFWYSCYQLNHPDLVREVLVAKSRVYLKEPRQMGVLSQFTGQGVITTEGPAWIRQRRIMQPAFQGPFIESILQAGVTEFGNRFPARQAPREIRLHDELMLLSLQTVMLSLFGVQSSEFTANLTRAVAIVSTNLMDEIANPFALPDWLPTPAKAEKRWALETLRGFVTDTIAQRRRSGNLGDDFLGILLAAEDVAGDGKGISDELIRIEAQTILFAAHHTVASGLTFAIWLLQQHPQILADVRAEIDSALDGREPTRQDHARLPLTERVLKEGMRLFPPAWSLFCRQAMEDDELAGYPIPKGSWIFMHPWVLHHDARFFPNPERFDPDRFLPEREREIPVGSYIPFGLGPHTCIGGRMGQGLMLNLLTLFVQRLDFALAPGQGAFELEPLISIRPKGDIRMVVAPRTKVSRPLEYAERGAAI